MWRILGNETRNDYELQLSCEVRKASTSEGSVTNASFCMVKKHSFTGR